MATLDYNPMSMDFEAMLYHRRCPCANPAPSAMVNKQLAIHLEKGLWLIDWTATGS
jgi:hypothetical protein